MFQKLVSRNDDIRRLVERGYAIGFDSNYMVVRDIPYLDGAGQLQTAAFIAKLVFVDDGKVRQDDHQLYFSGGIPHEMDGTPVKHLAGGPHTFALSDASADVVVQRSFSNKPLATGAYVDFFEKLESYVARICGPAMQKHGASPYTFRVNEQDQIDSVFKLNDTLTSRAEITDLARKFESDVVAIIGLGGTGAYVLDFIVKTPVKEIRTFDLDAFHVHNAFRSPGRLVLDELGMTKADVYADRYENFRTGLSAQATLIDATSREQLEGVTFAFVCVDKGSSRAGIFDLLMGMGIPFIDVGMGLHRAKSDLMAGMTGMLRTTYFAPDRYEQTKANSSIQLTDTPGDMYRTNIQIGELNALNATLAVIRFKQLRGFYVEGVAQDHLLFDLSDCRIVGNA